MTDRDGELKRRPGWKIANDDDNEYHIFSIKIIYETLCFAV